MMISTVETAQAQTILPKSTSIQERIRAAQVVPIFVATVLLLVVGALFVPNALTPASILALAIPASVMAIAGIGQTLVIQQRGIDLSTPGAITLGATALTTFASRNDWPFVLALVAALGLTALGGLINGLIITKLNITPIVATLGSNFLFFGAVWSISASVTAAPPPELTALSKFQVGFLPMMGIIAIILVLLVGSFMRFSGVGRRFAGVGSNPAAARASGVRVEAYIQSSYVVSSLSAGLAGILLAGFLGSSSLTLGNEYLLPIIAAVVVGGASLAGGKGSILATAIGALFLALIVQIVLSLGAPNSVQLLVQSIALVIAASARHIPWSRFTRSRQREAT